MLNFKELSLNGNDLELLIREILLLKGFKVQWSGIGADGGKDLICYEERASEFFNDKKTWLIQCKHNAHGGNSVGIKDLDEIITSCAQHKAKGYLLVCSTYPSSAVMSRLDAITNNPEINIDAAYWDATIIEQKLSTPKLWKIAQTFFPISSKNSSWQIYATDNPNQWVVNFKGYHFHLSNRIGSDGSYHLKSIENRIEIIKDIKLNEGHSIRIRAIYFDDKNGNYSWFLDYMYPHNEEPIISSGRIAKTLRDNYASDGQFYKYDVIRRPYHPYSDHFDIDHYDYYVPYLDSFRSGVDRDIDKEIKLEKYTSWHELENEELKQRAIAFDTLVVKLQSVSIFKLLRYVNSNIEDMGSMVRLLDWSDIISKLEIDVDHFFSAWFLFDVGENEESFLKFLSYLPQESDCWYRLTKVYVSTPKDNGEGSEFDKDEKSLFELSIRIHPVVVKTSTIARRIMNKYFEKCIIAIKKFQDESE